GPPVVIAGVGARPVLRAVREARDDSQLFRHAHEVAWIPRPFGAAEVAEVCAEASFEQEPAGYRRRPCDLLNPRRLTLRRAAGFRRRRRVAAQDTVEAHALFVPEEVELVA